VLLALLTLPLQSGCGGSSDNGVANKSGKEILAAATQVAQGAQSVHVIARASQGPLTLALDLTLAGDGGRGHVSFGKLNYEMVRIGHTVYVKGSLALYKGLGATRPVPNGSWLKLPVNGGPIAPFAALIELRGELVRLLSTPGSVTKGVKTKLHGQEVVELKERTKVYGGSLYVATTGKPYPVLLIKSAGRERGQTTFSEWDEPVSLAPPSPAIDIAALQH
jgi:hypothetical protein